MSASPSFRLARERLVQRIHDRLRIAAELRATGHPRDALDAECVEQQCHVLLSALKDKRGNV